MLHTKLFLKNYSLTTIIIFLFSLLIPLFLAVRYDVAVAAEVDSDGDQIPDNLEYWMAKTFAPLLYYDEKEHNIYNKFGDIKPGRDVMYFYQVSKYDCQATKDITEEYLIIIVATYEYDYTPIHFLLVNDPLTQNGDTERMAFCIDTSKESKPRSAKYGDLYYRITQIELNRYEDIKEVQTPDKIKWTSSTSTQPIFFVSEGKHAAYFSQKNCENFCRKIAGVNIWCEECSDDTAKPQKVSVSDFIVPQNNVGEAKKPIIIKQKLFFNERYEYFWGNKQRFCGGKNVDSPDRIHHPIDYFTFSQYESPWCAGSLGDKWLNPNNDLNINVWVVTGDKDGAGTDANIYLDIIGDVNDAKYIYLDNPDRNDFERGHIDDFSITAAFADENNLKLCVRVDGSKSDDPWYLDGIILNYNTPQSTHYRALDYVFDFKRWFNNTDYGCGKFLYRLTHEIK